MSEHSVEKLGSEHQLPSIVGVAVGIAVGDAVGVAVYLSTRVTEVVYVSLPADA